MNSYLPIVTLLLIAIVVFLLYLIIRRKLPQKYPYTRNPYFISYAERSFYRILEQVIANKYYIFPQVSLGSLLKVDKQGEEYWAYMNKISRKSIDFVIVDKTSFNALLVIELDDKSHNMYKREDRDAFLKDALNQANIDFIRFPVRSSYSPNDIHKELSQYFNNL